MKGFKKVVALLQITFLLAAMLPVMNFSKPSTVNAAVDGITNGGTYKIVSAYNGKAITQTDLSTFYANCVVWNTNAMSDLAKWTLTERGDYYSITNIVSGKSMKITGSNNGDNCDFNGYDNSNNYKWKLVPITSGTYAGCYYIVSAVKNSDGNEEYAEIEGSDTQNNDGAQVGIWTKAAGVDYEPRQIWRIEPVTADNITFTEAMNDQAVEAFKNKYYEYNSETGYNSLGQGFWGIAEVMEAMLDGYETTGKPIYKELFVNTYNDFIARNGETWESNGYNDDLTWAVLDSVRAYLLFGDSKYLDIAVNNYNIMYNRAITYGYNMLRWCEESDKRSSTNSCINGPATVAACYLGIATGDESYFEKAKSIYAAQRQHLYVSEGDNAGWVYDSINMSDGSKNTWCSTYNQGTYLGAATMLYQHYGDEMYLNDAKNIMNYTLKALCYNNILKNESTNSGDLSGFRGILMRYIRKFIVDLNQDEYLSFFKDNTRIAWMNRNSQNLFQNPWHAKTPEDVTWDEFAAYNVISLMANMPTYSDSIVRDAYSTIEAEDMDYTRGLISENSSGTSGGRSLGGVQNNHYTAYYNIDFGSIGASKVTFKYSKAPESDGAQGRIELRLGSKDGTLIGTAYLNNTSNWQDWQEVTADITKTTGVQNLYLVYKTDTSYVCNLDCFTFTLDDTAQFGGNVAVEGHQISTSIGGIRVVGSVEPRINNKAVTKWGFVYGLVSVNDNNFGITDNDMVVGSSNKYIKAYDSTSAGTVDAQLGASTTATYFVTTMTFGEFNSAAYSAKYKVRAYAVLEDGTYVYSSVSDYSVYDIADYLYQNSLMNTIDSHNYLYNNILKTVNSNYQSVDYNWNNSIAQ